MLLKHYFTPKIAHSSYILAGSGICALIDPRRDVDLYIDEARALGVRITHILETHLHADLVRRPPAPGVGCLHWAAGALTRRNTHSRRLSFRRKGWPQPDIRRPAGLSRLRRDAECKRCSQRPAPR